MITCVIPHARSIELLWATVCSVRMAGVKDIVVVGNGRPMETMHERLNTRMWWSTTGLGPARARERGAEMALGDWLFFLDDDSVVPSHIFSDIPDADCILFGSTCYGNPVFYHHLQEELPDSILDFPCAFEPKIDKPYPCVSGPNGAVLIKRKVWEDIGGYGGQIDGYGPDEPVLGFRLKAKGYKTVLDPRYIVWHYPSYETYKHRDDAFLRRHELALEGIRNVCRV